MPLDPNVLERLVLFRLNRGPAPMLDLFGAAAFDAATLALDMGVFDALADGARTSKELAAEIDADEDGVNALLGFLAAQGYVEREGDAYRNTAMAERWMLEGIGPWLRFWREQVFPFWEDTLEMAIRKGEPPETLYEHLGDDREAWRSAQIGFRAAARVTESAVRKRVDLGGAERLLDVGGGHGLFAAALCAEHPDLRATVFDLPAALGVVEETAAEYGVTERVGTEAGNYQEDDLGEGYDAALLFNVVHAHDGAENTVLLERVADALAPGGKLFVLDQFEGSGRGSVARAGVEFVNLTYLVTLGASVHAVEDVEGWLDTAGFGDVRVAPIRTVPGVSLLTATRQP